MSKSFEIFSELEIRKRYTPNQKILVICLSELEEDNTFILINDFEAAFDGIAKTIENCFSDYVINPKNKLKELILLGFEQTYKSIKANCVIIECIDNKLQFYSYITTPTYH